MRKLVIATLLCFCTMFTVLAVPTYGPPAPAIPAGSDAVITVSAVALTPVLANSLMCTTSGGYDYDTACTFVKIETQPSWPAVGGGVTTGVLTTFAVDLPKTQEKDVLPTRPIYFASAVIPNLPQGTVVTANSQIDVTKPNPAGGVFTISKKGSSSSKVGVNLEPK